jgi:hypothetical protein
MSLLGLLLLLPLPLLLRRLLNRSCPAMLKLSGQQLALSLWQLSTLSCCRQGLRSSSARTPTDNKAPQAGQRP